MRRQDYGLPKSFFLAGNQFSRKVLKSEQFDGNNIISANVDQCPTENNFKVLVQSKYVAERI